MASLPPSQQPKRRRLSLIPLALSRADSTKANTPVEHNLQSNISLTSGSSDVPPHSPTSKSSPKGISHFRRQSITQSIRRMSLSLTGQNLRSPSESNLGPTSPIYSLASPMSSSSPTTPIARTNMWGLPGRSAADRLRSLVSASTKASDSSAQFVKLRPQSPSSEREEDDLPEYLHGMRSEAETRPKATDESKPDPIRMSRSQHFRHQSLAKLTRTSEERPEQIEVDPPVEGTMTSTSIPIMLDHVKATTRRSSLSTLTSRLSTQSPSLLESHEKKILWRSKSFRSSSVDWSDRGSIAEGTSSLTSELDQRLRAINIKRARKMAQVCITHPCSHFQFLIWLHRYLDRSLLKNYTWRKLSPSSIQKHLGDYHKTLYQAILSPVTRRRHQRPPTPLTRFLNLRTLNLTTWTQGEDSWLRSLLHRENLASPTFRGPKPLQQQRLRSVLVVDGPSNSPHFSELIFVKYLILTKA